MRDLAAAERFEEAALSRDRLRALAEALARSRMDAWLLRPDRLVLSDAEGRRFRIHRGALARDDAEEGLGVPCPRDRADELAALRAWVARHSVRIEATDVPLAEPADGGAALAEILRRTSPQQTRQPDGQTVTRSKPQPNGG
jgi:hypothetical protein